jgi:hypothetical protein
VVEVEVEVVEVVAPILPHRRHHRHRLLKVDNYLLVYNNTPKYHVDLIESI